MELVKSLETEIHFQDRALARELESWRELGESDAAFKVHRSQLGRVCRTLDSARQVLGLAAADALVRESRDALLRGLQEWRKDLQALHLVWNFFREKLLQRLRPEFQGFLLAADDLAWACYLPFVDKLHTETRGLREPPLSFLSLEPAPFAQARGSSFAPQGLTSRELDTLYAILRRLPVPLIGLPWLQAGHFPDLCLVGHETAHIVADDLGLEKSFPEMVTRMDAISEERRPTWLRWMDETFADIVGLLACGAGYGYALTRALADDMGRIRTETPDATSAYPPRDVRVRVVRTTAERLGVESGFADAWHATYELSESEFSRDVGPLVESVLGFEFERLGGARLYDVLAPPRPQRIDEYVDAVLLGDALPGPTEFDIRCAIAAAAIAHAGTRNGHPRPTDGSEPYEKLAVHIAENRADGYRDDSMRKVRAAVMDERDTRYESRRMHEEDVSIGRDIASLCAEAHAGMNEIP